MEYNETIPGVKSVIDDLSTKAANLTLNSLGDLLQNGTHSDVVLCIMNGSENDKEPIVEKEIKAHKLILSSSSTVFAAMFVHDLEESKQSRVVITDISPEVAEAMVQYIYNGKIDSMEKYAMELLEAADKV